MTPTRFQKVCEVFLKALKQGISGRAAFLDKACHGDAALRDAVEKLLNEDEEAAREKFLETVTLDVDKFILDRPEDSMIGRRIGPYEILRLIEKGGMGSVYLAARVDDFKRQVAIKLIKKGQDTDEILRRFQIERQILAGLKHPNIAQLLDGGNTEDGLPYFVMEYVEGERIDTYCDKHKLNTLERLKLFRSVCDAVHFAHQNTVIHRDIKPSNILVTTDGRPKLVDFGIAKLFNREIGFQPVHYTRTEYRFMTPAYASPEQVRGDTITTVSDVYSLGVVLYELLTGHAPYELNSDLKREIERVVCEEDPPLPSHVIKKYTEVTRPGGGTEKLTPESVSKTRDGQFTKLRRKLAGDIDKIVLMALRKEPRRRYTSVEQFSSDIHRHLNGLLVIAQKNTVRYRVGKFVRRNRGLVVGAVVVIAVTISGAVVSGMSMARAAREKKAADEFRALELFDRAKRIAYFNAAGTEAALAEAIAKDPENLDFKIYRLFHNKRLEGVDDETIKKKAKRLIDQHPERYEPRILTGELKEAPENVPEWEFKYYRALALRYSDFAQAIKLLDESIEEKPWNFDATWERAVLYSRTKQYKKMRADAILLRKQRPELGLTWELEGVASNEVGMSERALECYEEALLLHNPPHWRDYFNRATAHHELGNLQKALEDYKEAIRLNKNEVNPPTYLGLAAVYYKLGNFDQAKKSCYVVLKLKPDEKIDYLHCAQLLIDSGDEVGGLETINRAISVKPDSAIAYYDRGDFYRERRQYNKAFDDFTAALEREFDDFLIDERNLKRAKTFKQRGLTRKSLYQITPAKKEFLREARADYEKAIELYIRHDRENEYASDLSNVYNDLGMLCLLEGSWNRALEAFEQAAKTNTLGRIGIGIANWCRSEEARALEDFKRISQEPGYAILNLWIWEIQMRNNKIEEAKATLETAKQKETDPWYKSIILFYIDQSQTTEKEIIEAIQNDVWRRCEAYYYIGAKAFVEGRFGDAQSKFRECIKTNLPDCYEYILANWHLTNMKENDR